MKRSLLIVSAYVFVLSGCGDSGGDDDGPMMDAGPAIDAQPMEQCTSDGECDNGQHCDGAERCMPGVEEADAQGCVPGTPVTCEGDDVCDEVEDICRPDCGETADMDGDGFDSIMCGGDDCDDTNPDRWPGNFERCDPDNVDEDCRPETFGIRDFDGDGYIDAACCNIDEEDGTMYCGDDCDDEERSTNPNQLELCGDEVDNNCDGETDVAELYEDSDTDGFGDPAVTMTGACMPGWVTDDSDCSPDDGFIHPGAIDKCDGFHNDCDLVDGGMADPTEDADGDLHSAVDASCVGLGEVGGGGAFPRDDCNDDPSNGGADDYMGAMEICGDGRDNDCDGTVDESMQRVCLDSDGDGHGDPATLQTINSCDIPDGMVESALCDDCDDSNGDRFPGNTDYCDGVDADCDVEGEDVDGDMHAPMGANCIGFVASGEMPGVFPKDDCDDSDGGRYPGALELCDGRDANCLDSPIGADEDADGDGYAPVGVTTCIPSGQPGANVDTYPATDCNDGDGAIRPGAEEVCDDIDNDCNLATSELTRWCPSGGYCAPGGVCTRGQVVADLGSRYAKTRVLLRDGTVFGYGGGSYPDWLRKPEVGLLNIVELIDYGCERDYVGNVTCNGSPISGLGPALSYTLDTIGSSPSRFECAVRASGETVCRGENTRGQLGDGTTVEHVTWAPVSGSLQGREVDGSGSHACVRTAAAEVYCWGASDSVMDPITTPTRIEITNVVAISVGDSMCALRDDATLWCWDLLSPVPLKVTYDDGGTTRDLLARSFGATYGDTVWVVTEPDGLIADVRDGLATFVGATPDNPFISGGNVATHSGFHSCLALGDGGMLFGANQRYNMICWGRNTDGECGQAHSQSCGEAGCSQGYGSSSFTDFNKVDLADEAGSAMCALRGWEAICWGPDTPTAMPSDVVERAYYPPSTLSGDGSRWLVSGYSRFSGYGSARMFTIAGGLTNEWTITDPEGAIPQVSGVGAQHQCATERFNGGDLFCWGSDTYGQLGTPTAASESAPVYLASGVSDVAVGEYHTCAIISGTVHCWGGGGRGQLGLGDMTTRTTPTSLGLTATDLAAGDDHTCAVTGTTAVCWGDGVSGQLGTGDFSRSTTPAPVVGLTDVAVLAAGGDHTCALTGAGEVYCWGKNSSGQLGVGTLDDVATPTRVTGLPAGMVQVAAAEARTCATGEDGTVYCWGAGPIGDGFSIRRTVPATIWDL